MQHRYAYQNSVLWWVIALACCAGCSATKREVPPTLEPAPAAGTGPTAFSPLNDAAVASPAREQVFATAMTQLAPLGPEPVGGTATWRMTTEGVDLELAVDGCVGLRQFSLQILDAHDCSPASLFTSPWPAGRNLPYVHCFGVGLGGTLAYERNFTREDAWTIGGAASSELVGRVLIVRNAVSDEPLACGTITRAGDLARAALPAADQAPRAETRAALSGLCFARQFPNTGPDCPDPVGILSCVQVHGDVASCLSTCAEYTQCLDTTTDVCSYATCIPTPECMACQSALGDIALGFCGEHITCAPPVTPDGPCERLSGCCMLQGENAGSCLGVVSQLLTSLGGDTNCVGSMHDWDALSHMHAPCTFGLGDQRADAASAQASEPLVPNLEASLVDGTAGAACTTDVECSGGRCVHAGGVDYCTRACDAAAECGSAGMCVTLAGDVTQKRCLAKCQDQSDCRSGFICAGGIHGSKINLPGSCRPRRQVDQLADAVAGRACTQDADCPGGQCDATNLSGTSYPGGHCSGRCYEDAQCGLGGICAWPRGSVDAGHCLHACAVDSDCGRVGYGCRELGDGERLFRGCYPQSAPLPDHTVGKPCREDRECGAAPARCAKKLPYVGLLSDELTSAPDGYCTQACALDAECSSEGQCVNYGTRGGICLARCSDANPCREGYACYAHLRDADPLAMVCTAVEPDVDAGTE